MRPVVQAGLIALALGAAAPLGGCVLDDMWSESARDECARESSGSRQMDCNDRVDRIERDRDGR